MLDTGLEVPVVMLTLRLGKDRGCNYGFVSPSAPTSHSSPLSPRVLAVLASCFTWDTQLAGPTAPLSGSELATAGNILPLSRQADDLAHSGAAVMTAV